MYEWLVQSLRDCSAGVSCDGCPYYVEDEDCQEGKMASDAADAIEKLEKELEKMRMQATKWKKAWKTANELYEWAKGERKK